MKDERLRWFAFGQFVYAWVPELRSVIHTVLRVTDAVHDGFHCQQRIEKELEEPEKFEELN